MFTRIFKCGVDKYIHLFYIFSASLIRHFPSAKKENSFVIPSGVISYLRQKAVYELIAEIE